MKLDMTLPLMEPDLNRGVFDAWAQAVGACLCFGERMTFLDQVARVADLVG
jgi:hypothetical protein